MHNFEDLLQQASQARREHRHTDARRDLTEAVVLARAGQPHNLARALTALGQIERDLNHLEAARQNYEEAVAIYSAENDPQRLAHTIRHLADIDRHLGNTAAADHSYMGCLALYRADPKTSALDLANTLRGYALLKEEINQKAEARAMWEEAGKLYGEANVEAGVAESARKLAAMG
jgi:tetratricopeptide (TPR) repeat protein